MLSSLLFRRIFIISFSLGIYLFLYSGLTLAANESSATDEGVEVMMRGPIHEAFADVSVDETQPGAITPRHVPDPINEIPAEFRPEGKNVEWISGYWSWDEEKDDFIWVSGVWRDVPPGRQWIPGYWVSVESGNQFISGYWTDIDQPKTVYLPPPPKPLETGPSSPSLTPQQVWMDGNWIWYHNRYAWQPGYWLEQRPDMAWIPAHYVWTPRGYVFVGGYWDYQLARRGVMFAPLYYSRPIHRNYGYFYTPSIVLDFDRVFLSLFIRRDSRHYYFGDYYGSRYEKRGYRPWYSKHATRYGYDPYYRSYLSNRHRNDRKWENNSHRQIQYRRDHKAARPSRMYGRQTNLNAKPSQSRTGLRIDRQRSNVSENRDNPAQFTRLNHDQNRDSQVQNRQFNQSQREHSKVGIITTRERKSWQTTGSGKPGSMTRSSSKIKNNYSKSTVSAKQQGKHFDNHRNKPQLQTKGRAQVISQERQRMRPEKRTTRRWANKTSKRPQRAQGR